MGTDFEKNFLDGAPEDAYDTKDAGAKVIKATETTKWASDFNVAARDWVMKNVDFTRAYVDDWHGNPAISSLNGQLLFEWYEGRV